MKITYLNLYILQCVLFIYVQSILRKLINPITQSIEGATYIYLACFV